MAITDTRPETGTDPAVAPSLVPAPVSILGSGDHTVVGLVYIVAAILLGIAGSVAWGLSQIHVVSDSFLDPSAGRTLEQTATMGLVLLVLVPLFVGIGTFIVPLQVGARSIAFPRAAAAGLWTWLLSAGLFIVAACIDGGFGGGREKAVSLEMLSVIGLVVALLLGTVCILATVIGLRRPDMTLDRVPMTSFAFLVAGSVWILTLPLLAGDVLLLWVDLRYGDGSISAANIRFGAVSWILGQPQIYAFVIPGLGIAIDVVATFTGARLGRRGLLLTGIGAVGVLSAGAWAQPLLYPEAADQIVWQVIVVAMVLPVLLVLGGVAAAMKAGRPAPKGALGLAVVSMLLLLLGAVAGALQAITPLELRSTGAAATGQFVLVVAAGLAAAAAGLSYWAPKMTGRIPADGAAKLGVLVFLGGGALGGVPLVVQGFSTRFTSIAELSDALLWISVVGAALLALGLVLGLLGLLSGTRRSAPAAGADPWGTGQTLEWAFSSPPGSADPGDLPIVHSAEPLLDEEA